MLIIIEYMKLSMYTYANGVHGTWYSVCIWGLDKEQMYGGEAVTACSKFLQFSGH